MFERFTARRATWWWTRRRRPGSPARDPSTRGTCCSGWSRPADPRRTCWRRWGSTRQRLARDLRGELRSGGLDAEALASVGIDLEAVRESADAVFGKGALDRAGRAPVKGHIPFTADAKKVLELALREAVRLRTNRIDGAMLLLGMLRGTGSSAERC